MANAVPGDVVSFRQFVRMTSVDQDRFREAVA